MARYGLLLPVAFVAVLCCGAIFSFVGLDNNGKQRTVGATIAYLSILLISLLLAIIPATAKQRQQQSEKSLLRDDDVHST